MKEIRLFFGVAIEPEIREQVVSWQKRMQHFLPSGTRLVSPNNYHITLLFLGDCDSRKMERSIQAAKGAALKLDSFPAIIVANSCFPNRKKPRILFLGLKNPGQELFRLNHLLAGELDWAHRGQQYQPHLTIARLDGTSAVGELTGPEGMPFWVGGFHLYSSELSYRGAIYRSEHYFKLGRVAKSE